MSQNFTFNISLSVLNHLGRNLYRNFITVIGEAISNSWDADANNVWIYIDRENDSFIRSEEHTSELQSRPQLVCRLRLEKKNVRNTGWARTVFPWGLTFGPLGSRGAGDGAYGGPPGLSRWRLLCLHSDGVGGASGLRLAD